MKKGNSIKFITKKKIEKYVRLKKTTDNKRFGKIGVKVKKQNNGKKMTTYISILRGINVSGQNLIKMDALQQMYKNLCFDSVTTYIQSGNVVFRSIETEYEKLEKEISKQIKKDFGFEAPVIVLTMDNLSKIIDNNPFLKDYSKDPNFLHVTFLSSKPEKYDIKTIEEKKLSGEEIVIVENVVYLYCPNGYGKTKLNNTFLETKLKVGATTRNWKTVNKLLQIAREIR